MPDYRLVAKYWDGQKTHPVGAVLNFPEGAAPKGSVLEGEVEAPDQEKKKKD